MELPNCAGRCYRAARLSSPPAAGALRSTEGFGLSVVPKCAAGQIESIQGALCRRSKSALSMSLATARSGPRQNSWFMRLAEAMTQNNLGNALQTLGERESGTARLEEAVAAYRAALEERTRERVPLDWAGTQNNLGNALWRLGERESGTARLEEAVAAYRAALEEYTRERVPLDWAMTQTNLGNALLGPGERESGTARLDEAVAAYRAALEERTRERVPLQWAATQTNLA